MNIKPVGFGEVLTVLVIVAGVGAVVAPVLTRADVNGDQQKSIACASNLKQLALGVLQYVQDFDECYPSGANWYGTGSGWAQQIRPYMGNGSVYRCPSESNGSDVISYGYNSNLVRLTGPVPSAPAGMRLAEASAPAYSMLLFEVANNGDGVDPGYTLSTGAKSPFAIDVNTDIHRTGMKIAPIDGWSPAGRGMGEYKGELSGMGSDPANGAQPLQYATGPMSGSSSDSAYFEPTGRHDGRSNFAFLDGHVRSLEALEVSAGKNNPVPGRPEGVGIAKAASDLGETQILGTFSMF
jgi:prepilin-type processing-associated H-X9-DG protein